MKANFVKLSGGQLVPVSDVDKELVDKIRAGEVVRLTYTRMRNYQFFKKWWALVNFAYDYWTPQVRPDDPQKKWMKKVTPEKNLDQFRKDLTILAGYYNAFYRINGEVRIEAKSIAFGNMKEEEFEKLYSATVQVVINQICIQYSEDELRSIIDQAMQFAA